MNSLVARMKEFWENLKDSYPLGNQVKSADELASFFMEEGPRLEYGDDFDIPEYAEAEDTANTEDPFGIDNLNDFEPNEEEISPEAEDKDGVI